MNSTCLPRTDASVSVAGPSMPPLSPSDLTPARYRQERIAHWDDVARRFAPGRGLSGSYHRRVEQMLRQVIPPGQRVLELGCGRGDLLAALQPAHGVGVDFSSEMISQAVSRHSKKPELHFVIADVHELAISDKFDFIVLSDLVNDFWDVQAALEKIRRMTTSRTRVVFNVFSQLWQLPLWLAQRSGLKQPMLPQNWLTVQDVSRLLHLAGFEIVHHREEILWPLCTPVIDSFFNRVLVRFWPFRHAAMSNVIVARPTPEPSDAAEPMVSVIVPARNEAGNIAAIFSRTAEMGAGTELIFVEGHSTDDTLGAIERAIAANPHRRAKLLRQSGQGKGDAVRLGFASAGGEVLMILDADLTVPPEDLPRFYQAIRSGKGEFINGVRLVYPMEAQAMQTLNLLANKFFGMTFTWLLGQPIKDTLCGTKVISKLEYERLVANRSYFGDFDPFGDFDLLFGAAKLNLKMVDLPVRYRQRTYGSTNIQRFRHGLLLLRMVVFAARRIKFV